MIHSDHLHDWEINENDCKCILKPIFLALGAKMAKSHDLNDVSANTAPKKFYYIAQVSQIHFCNILIFQCVLWFDLYEYKYFSSHASITLENKAKRAQKVVE